GAGQPSNVSAQPVLQLLIEAQTSLDSYLKYLRQEGDLEKSLSEVEPFVARPLQAGTIKRPYHAVRDVLIYCRIPNVDVEGLVLVDLPGAGQAGLEVDREFLADLDNDVDMLVQVKRPEKTTAFFTGPDTDTLNLAELASGDVDLKDF